MYAFVSILYIFSWDFSSLLSFRFVHGIGSAMATPVAMAYAAELAPKGQEGKYMGTMNLAMFGGMGLGPLIGGSLSDLFDLSAPFYFMGALTAMSLVLTMIFLPEVDKDLRFGPALSGHVVGFEIAFSPPAQQIGQRRHPPSDLFCVGLTTQPLDGIPLSVGAREQIAHIGDAEVVDDRRDVRFHILPRTEARRTEVIQTSG